MPNRDRLPLILRTLMKESDDEKWLTTADLRKVLEEEGYEWSIRSLRKDINALRSSGFEIAVREFEGASTQYAWMGREWSAPELQILVDAVSAAQFIPQDRSKKLIGRLSRMSGPSHTEKLRPRILVSEHIKAKNRNMLSSVQAIRKAIDRDRKIVFRYLRYTPDKEQVPKHLGTPEEEYVVSPYATVWNNDRYYLVGWSDKRQKVAVFRIDRMEVPKQVQRKRVPPPADFDVRDYTDKVFQMFDGPEENVTLHCALEILDQVIDRFGEGVRLENVTEDSFEVTVPVKLSTTFYAWVFKYVGKMRILGPEGVKEEYKGYLEMAMEEV